MAVEAVPQREAGGWSRRYPPLLVLAAAVAVAILVLPSALHIPQTNPNPVLEYAPVPPEEPNPDVPPGNFSSLGLGGSSTLSQGARPATPSPPATRKPSALLKPRPYRCYTDPKTGERRQTEDPMSPVCVDFFEGDNFGATWQGVTADEVTVLVYLDRGGYADEVPPGVQYVDVDTPLGPPCPKTWPQPPPQRCDHLMVRMVRALGNYFNARFQTYKRRVHFWVYWTSAGNPEARRKDAIDNVKVLSPFAVLDEAIFDGYNDDYDQSVAARDTLVFSSSVTSRLNSFYQEYAPQAWGFWPDVERWAPLYASYICQKVAPYPVAHSGNSVGALGYNGQPRRFGLFYTTDPGARPLQVFRDYVKDRLARCGVTPAAEGTFPKTGFVVDNSDAGDAQRRAVQQFQSAGVTTVLYLGGVEGKFSQMAAANQYYPEIVVAGDLFNDNAANAQNQNQEVWRNAWAVSYGIRSDRQEAGFGYRAAREGDPGLDDDAARFANTFYPDFFMLFTGIQVAGPRLTPDRIDQGFHALPPKDSHDPFIASCYFETGDYTCVKDGMEIWWDPNGQVPGGTRPGCWRMVRDGSRFRAGRWVGGDDVFKNRSDPCNGFGGTYRLRAA